MSALFNNPNLQTRTKKIPEFRKTGKQVRKLIKAGFITPYNRNTQPILPPSLGLNSRPTVSSPKLSDSVKASNESTNIERSDESFSDDILIENWSDNKHSCSEEMEAGEEPCTSGSEVKPNTASPFPDLVVLFTNYYKSAFNPFKYIAGIQLINRCLKQFNYGPLNVDCHVNNGIYYMSIKYNGKTLAEAAGTSGEEAKMAAGARLIQVVRSTNFSIEPKSSYFNKNKLPNKSYCNKKKIPEHVLNVDPSQSHIYKVVCLKSPSAPPFQHPLSGSVDYVASMDELWQYIEDYIESGSEADLYVLNVEKKQYYKKLQEIIGNRSISARTLLGSNEGLVISHWEKIKRIFEDLMKCGGENIKYRLIPPGGKLQSYSLSSEINVAEDEDAQDGGERTSQSEEQQVGVSERIAENLILMDFFNTNGLLAKAFHLIKLSIYHCPSLGEFKIKKKLDRNTSLFTCDAFIDGTLVGRARGYKLQDTQVMAAENALKNLKTCCVYIESKKSYFGCDKSLPKFLTETNPHPEKNEIYRIVDPKEATNDNQFGELILKFKSSNLQDLFFLKNFTSEDLQLVMSMAKDVQLNSWQIGNGCVCVYKRRPPKEIYEELVRAGGENQKYRLIAPLRKLNLNPGNIQKQCGIKESNRTNLSDFENSNVDPLYNKDPYKQEQQQIGGREEQQWDRGGQELQLERDKQEPQWDRGGQELQLDRDKQEQQWDRGGQELQLDRDKEEPQWDKGGQEPQWDSDRQEPQWHGGGQESLWSRRIQKPSWSRCMQEPQWDRGRQEPPSGRGGQKAPCSRGRQEPQWDRSEQEPPWIIRMQGPQWDRSRKEPPRGRGEQESPCSRGMQEPQWNRREQEPPWSRHVQEPQWDRGRQAPPCDNGRQEPLWNRGKQEPQVMPVPQLDRGRQQPQWNGVEQDPQRNIGNQRLPWGTGRQDSQWGRDIQEPQWNTN